jgi:hypothetical protein
MAIVSVNAFPSWIDVKRISMHAAVCFWFFSLAARADSYPLIWLCGSDPWCEKDSPKRVRFFQLSFKFKLRPELGQLSGAALVVSRWTPLGTWLLEERKLFSEIAACFVIRTWSFSRLCYLHDLDIVECISCAVQWLDSAMAFKAPMCLCLALLTSSIAWPNASDGDRMLNSDMPMVPARFPCHFLLYYPLFKHDVVDLTSSTWMNTFYPASGP